MLRLPEKERPDNQSPSPSIVLRRELPASWWLAMVGLCGVAIAALTQWSVSPVIPVLGLSLLAVGVPASLWYVRATLQLFDRGFAIVRRGQRHAYSVEDIVGVAYRRAAAAQLTRGPIELERLTLWWRVDGHEIVERFSIPVEPTIAPVRQFVDRLLDRMADDAASRLASGHPVSGQGWSLTRTSLAIDDEAFPDPIVLNDIVALDWFGNEFCLWCDPNGAPAVRFADHCRNILLLERLLVPVVDENAVVVSTKDRHTTAEDEFGRFLFRHRRALGVRIGLLLVTLVCTAFCISSAVMAIVFNDGGIWILTVTLLASGLLAAYAFSVAESSCTDVFERGLRERYHGRWRSCTFDSIQSLRWQVLPQYIQSVLYVGATTDLELIVGSGPKMTPFRLRSGDPTRAADFARVRDFVADRMAVQLAQRLATLDSVAWTPEIEMSTNGLIRQRKRIGRTDVEEEIPFESINLYEFHDGILRVWTNYQERSVFSIKESEPNFFPGLVVFERLLETAAPELKREHGELAEP